MRPKNQLVALLPIPKQSILMLIAQSRVLLNISCTSPCVEILYRSQSGADVSYPLLLCSCSSLSSVVVDQSKLYNAKGHLLSEVHVASRPQKYADYFKCQFTF